MSFGIFMPRLSATRALSLVFTCNTKNAEFYKFLKPFLNIIFFILLQQKMPELNWNDIVQKLYLMLIKGISWKFPLFLKFTVD